MEINELWDDGDEKLDEELVDLAENYVDDELDPIAKAEFEERLSVDPKARLALAKCVAFDSFITAVVAGAIKGKGSESAPRRRDRCRSARELIPLYQSNNLDTSRVARLCGHLNDCDACTSFWEGYVDGLRTAAARARRHLILTRVIVLGLGVTAILGFVLH